jgi:hypothetical protein
MSNPYGSPDAAGSEPTQPIWGAGDPRAANPVGEEPAGAAGPGPAASQAASFGRQLRNDRRKAPRWTLGLVAAALLAGGGVIAGLSLSGHSTPSTAQSQQAAALDTTLGNAGTPGPLTALGATAMGGAQGTQNGRKAGASAPICAKARHVARVARRAGLPRLARAVRFAAARCGLAHHPVFAFFLLRGIDGQLTVQTRQGTRTLAYERGVIQSVQAGKSIVVKASDGTIWTWDLVATTVVRDRQGKVSESTLAAGAPVWVGGPVVRGVKDARLIVLRPPLPASAFPSSTPGS